MAKKIISLLIICFCAFVFVERGLAAETYTLKAGVSLVDRVPKGFFGTWRVSSNLISTNSEASFKPNNVDLWNLSKTDNVISLENPFSGANASITVDEVSDKLIKFKKNGYYDNKKLTDIVQLELRGDIFYGTNYLIMETISEIDNSVIKTEKATYKLTGEKISGKSIK